MQATQSKKSGELHSAIEKAQALQQREQLRQMITDKFNKDLARGNKNITKIIEQIVGQYFMNEKVTEGSLKQLKQNVTSAIEEYKKINKSQKASSKGGQSVASKKQFDEVSSKKSQKSEQKLASDQMSQKSGRSNKSSNASSSVATKSVYHVEGDDDDEWATLVKFDTELFKKEKELEKLREAQFKKKMKVQLDKQLEEKKKRKKREVQEQQQYNNLQIEQAKVYDQREKDKKNNYQKKIELEKKMRDQQVKEENKRKKNEKKREDELDKMLVQKIKEEIQEEESEQDHRRQKEKQRFRQVLLENQQNRIKMKHEADKEVEEDVKALEEYGRLQDELEERRANEKKERENKIKKVMSSFADSVIKDQKAQIRAEDEKMLRHIENQQRKDEQEEMRRKKVQQDDKQKMRQYLAKQVEEKRIRQLEEKEIDEQQAKIWVQDTENFLQNEKNKQEYLKGVYKKHEQVLKHQMDQKYDKKNKRKMNTLELLYNKALMKAAGEQDQHVKKAKLNSINQ